MRTRQAGDREEIKAVEILCENRVTPLRVGSVKSNMGHTEAASALCAIAKAIIAMKSGAIPPNINYKTPRNDIDALHNGLIEVSKRCPLPQLASPLERHTHTHKIA